MIAYLEGRLAEIGESAVVIVTSGGVGYEVEVPASLLQSLPDVGSQCSLRTELLVRENELRLCGFATAEDRDIFRMLITIPKVGPRIALSILSTYRPQDLRAIVAGGSSQPLTAVSGVGKRTAEAIFHELSYKLKADGAEQVADATGSQQAGAVYRDVLEGLKGLGYTEAECGKVVQELLKSQPDLDVPSLLRASLKALARKG